MSKIRIDKYLANAGAGTRSEVKKMCRSGRVTVDGAIVKDPGTNVEEGVQTVCLDRVPISLRGIEWYMLNKPAGCLSSTEKGPTPTVIDLLEPQIRGGMFPVGRLDIDTEGFLLLTNDGKTSHYLLSPARHVDKVYHARITGELTESKIKKFCEGLDIGDEKKTQPAGLVVMTDAVDHGLAAGTDVDLRIGENTFAELYPLVDQTTLPEGQTDTLVTLREGRFHQVKRMFEAIGCHVEYLERLSMGALTLDPDLKKGEYRELTEEEIESLKASAGIVD